MSEKLRVMLLLSSLHGGGAERVAVHLLNRCDPDRVDVRMALLRRAGPFLAEADESRIDASPMGQNWLAFEGHNSSFYRPHKLAAAATLAPLNLRGIIRARRPQVVMSFLKGMSLLTWLVLQGMGPKRPIWIAREGNNTDAVIDDELTSPLARAAMRRLTRHCYRAADCFLVNSQEMAHGLEGRLGLERRRMRVIHNPVDLDQVTALAKRPIPRASDRPFILAVGRLEHQKGHDLLLEAFARSGAAERHDLVIIGRGTAEARLRARAAALGLGETVTFLDFSDNPWAWMAKARLFVLPSRWEGCPSVAVEALACGAPALVTACEFGPAEVIENGVNGWVAPAGDAEGLADAMRRLLAEPELLARLAAKGPARAADFAIAPMVEAYSRLFEEQAAFARLPRRVPSVLTPETATA